MSFSSREIGDAAFDRQDRAISREDFEERQRPAMASVEEEAAEADEFSDDEEISHDANGSA